MVYEDILHTPNDYFQNELLIISRESERRRRERKNLYEIPWISVWASIALNQHKFCYQMEAPIGERRRREQIIFRKSYSNISDKPVSVMQNRHSIRFEYPPKQPSGSYTTYWVSDH